MICNCCFCGKSIEDPYTLTVSKADCETEQIFFCHEACLEAVVKEPLYLKCL